MKLHPAVALRALFLCGVLGLAACTSTSLSESWIEPSVKELPRFQKTFVAYLGGDTAAERVAEDALAKHLSAPEVVKKYELFGDGQQLDKNKVRDELRAKGFDGAVVMRLSRVEEQVSSTPMYPPDYYSMGGYWGNAYPYGVDVRTDEIVHIVTNVYSVADDKLLYSARSETFNPGSTLQIVDEIAEAVAKDLEAKGLKR